jgi:hypothetical protein
MKFEDMPLDLQARLSLEKWCKFHELPFSSCGAGTYPAKTGRDVCASFRVTSKKGMHFYIYFQVAYIHSPQVPGLGKCSQFSSIVLYDFGSERQLAKIHMDALADIKGFYPQLESILL